MKRIFVIFVFMCCASLLQAQFAAHMLNSKDGLTNELVKCSAVDSLGFVWAVTDGGLFRFNGSQFENYVDVFETPYLKWVKITDDGDVYITCDKGLFKANYTSTRVTFEKVFDGTQSYTDHDLTYPKEITQLNDGSVWIADDFCISRIDGENLRKYYLGRTNAPDCFQRAASISETVDGTFIFTHAGRVLSYDKDKDDVFAVDLPVTLSRLNASATFDEHTVLVASDDGLIYFDTQTQELTFDRSLKNISYIEKDENGHMILATWRNGIYQVNDNRVITPFQINNGGIGSVNHVIREGQDFWVSSDNGVVFCQHQHFAPKLIDLCPGYIQDICELNDQTFVAYEQTLFRMNIDGSSELVHRHSDVILQVEVLPGSTAGQEKIRFSDAAGKVYEMANGQLKLVHNWQQLGGNVFFMMVDKEKNIWYAQSHRQAVIRENTNGELTVFASAEGIVSPISVIRENPDGEIFVGSEGDNSFLYRYNDGLQQFDNLSTNVSFDFNTRMGVNDIAFTDSLTYLGTDFGVYTFDGVTFHNVDLGGLTNEDIKAITTTDHAIWFGLSAGLVRLDQNATITFDSRHGLPTKTLSYRGLHGHGSNLWVGTANGLAQLEDDLGPQQTSVPLLTSYRVNGADALVSSLWAYSDDLLRLDFTVAEFPKDQISYRWKRSGDTEWQTPELETGILLNNLSSGTHGIEIQARKSGNYLWSDSLLLKVESSIIWYKTAWFIEAIVMFLLALIYLVARREKKRVKERELRLQLMVSERTAELEHTKEKALASARAKSEFLSTMSHEIRTPMNAVMGIAHLMLEEELTDDQRYKMESLRFSANNLLEILNDILDYNKIESGKLELEQRVFGIRQFMRNIHTGMETRARQKDISLNYHIDKEVPDLVIGDSTRLSQVMVNLLNNAIKFTSKGGVECKVLYRGLNDEGVKLRIEVQDSGIGIPKDKQKVIFQSFTQANSSTTRKFGGTGLGLTIVKNLVELMGGEVEVESQEGVGTTFSFEICMGVQDGKIFETGPSGANKQILRGLRVLVAEDNEMNIMVASSFLKLWEVDFTIARNGQEAVELHRAEHFDVILMDLQMPVMDGVEAAQTIRGIEEKTGQYTPIIALTASALTQSKDKVMAAGMDNFVTKPFRPQELLQALAQSMG